MPQCGLVGGDPGIGKSTLLLQLAVLMDEVAGPVLYISGEESERQIKMRADRLELEAHNLYLVTETEVNSILAHIEAIKPRLVIVDSIQTTYMESKASAAGSVSQVRECASTFRELAKNSGIAIFLVGHVTKEGVIAGPRVLEHIVDTVLYLEGDRFQAYRLLRSVKNRFGPTSEVGVFEMRDRGLVEITNPSEVFIAERVVNAPGSAIAVTLEGTRPLLVEIQALASQTVYPSPPDSQRHRLQPDAAHPAVLTRQVGIKLSEKDIFLNVISGLRSTSRRRIWRSRWPRVERVGRACPRGHGASSAKSVSAAERAVSQTATRVHEA